MINYIVASVKEGELDIYTARFEESAWEHAEYLVEEAEAQEITMVGVFEGEKCLGHWFAYNDDMIGEHGWYILDKKLGRPVHTGELPNMRILKEPQPAEAVYCEVDCVGKQG